MYRLEKIKKENQYREKSVSFETGDIETNHWTRFQVAGFYDGIQYREFFSIRDYVNFIYNCSHSLNLFFHFGGGFDFLFIIEECFRQRIEMVEIVPRGSMILSLKIVGKYKTHTIRDSCALLPFSLKRITESFNVKTKKGEYDHSLNRELNDEMRAYLKDDTVGLYESLDAFFNSDLVKRSGPSFTIAGQAQKIIRCYLKEDIERPSNAQNEFMRLACHGGRTEIFKPIGKNLREYDCNSLYPSVMREEYPSGKILKTFSYVKGKMGIYDVEVYCPDHIKIPIIPFKDDKKLLFPKGKFKTVTTSDEIDYARSIGYEIKVNWGYYFEGKTAYFKEFVEDLYDLRCKSESNTVDNVLTKLILNAGFGRFILKLDKTNLLFDRPTQEEIDKIKDPKMLPKQLKDVKIDGKTYEIWQKPVKLKTYTNCGIGAFILAKARIKMHKFMYPIADNVYYTDTDSIWTDLELPNSNKLGELKLEKPKIGDKVTYDEVCFLLPKTYIAQNTDFKKIAMKGFDSRKIKHFNYNDFRSALYGEIKLSVDHSGGLARLKTAMIKNKILLKKGDFNKTIQSTYNKRILNLKNNTSEAITLKL